MDTMASFVSKELSLHELLRVSEIFPSINFVKIVSLLRVGSEFSIEGEGP